MTVRFPAPGGVLHRQEQAPESKSEIMFIDMDCERVRFGNTEEIKVNPDCLEGLSESILSRFTQKGHHLFTVKADYIGDTVKFQFVLPKVSAVIRVQRAESLAIEILFGHKTMVIHGSPRSQPETRDLLRTTFARHLCHHTVEHMPELQFFLRSDCREFADILIKVI